MAKKSKKTSQKNNELQSLKQKGSIKQHNRGLIDGLTPVENEVYFLLTQKGLNPETIAKKRKTTLRAVYQTLERLKKKGILTYGTSQVKFFGTHSTPTGSKSAKNDSKKRCASEIRLHGQQYRINILEKSAFFERVLKKCNTLTIAGETIRIHKNSIEVYSKTDFWAQDPKTATQEAQTYFNRLFRVLENDLKIKLCKDRSQNIKKCANHYAITNNEIARYHKETLNENLKVKGADGKTRLITDNSLGLNELEGIHPETAEQDTENIQSFYNQIMDGYALEPKEVMRCIYDLGRNQEKIEEQIIQISSSINFIFKTQLENLEMRPKKTKEESLNLDNFMSNSMFM
jgi:DNA-binding CsgD family transcriptional regulator